MEQPAKKRRLLPAPKESAQPAPFPESLQQQQVPEAPPAERHDFESFARHLQDAAMLIQRQTERPPYDSVSVLLLRWEEDTSAEADLTALENILRDRYNYRTDRWTIPTVPNPSIKLGVQMASFLEHGRNNHLLIIYYAGYGYVADNQLYWACNNREDAAKLKWDGVRCLFEDAHKSPSPPPQLPILFTLTPGKGQSLSLAPLPPRAVQQSPHNGDAESHAKSKEDQLIDPGSVTDLRFDEARVLVCTTFVGDASPDMSFFNGWLHNTPPLAAKIEVEGMFLGPPTMLLISMPHSIWNVVQHDKVCCFLGYITSHNMIHLYQKLKGSSGIKATAKEVEDGRILLEAREMAVSTPAMHRRSLDSKDAAYHEALSRLDTTPSGISYATAAAAAAIDGKDDVEDSAEMQEAAEQLKALSHVRHLSDEAPPAVERQQRTTLPDGVMTANHEDSSSHESGADDTMHSIDMNTPNSKPKQRRSLQKATPKQETRCTLCSHAPFKDSSSLRKHIAAAHTRPFPCAFSFAGCTSTFGSKNEWKRHIASQHLCLQYYRCSSCPQSTIEGKGNEFNRKDLFTQHLRRMHAPFAIKKAIAKGDSKLQVEWEGHVKEMQTTCLVTRRSPPQKSACPKPDCQSVFEGPGSWDEWTEHVGRHMEKGEGQRLGVDRLLAKWALDEGIIERKEDGEYRLCAGNGAVGGGGGTVSGGDSKDSISVAFPEPKQEVEEAADAGDADDKMEVDT
ncbi:hypothetical protein K4K59_007957 [Colletotrichum sp. SAR11_240]|nr:hypothetical protein K4K59_007957 [Colletotrichum sp. SAR11_240]